MTVQKDVTKNIYVGNGSTRTFPFTFECPAEHPEYIKVYLMQDDGTALATSDYQLDMDAKQITYPSSGTALPEGKKLVIMRELPLQQMMNLVNNGPYFAENIETAFDECVMAMQQIAEKLNRSIIMSVDIDGDVFVNEVPFEAGKSFRISDDGKSIVLTEDPAKVLPLVQGVYAQTQTQAQNAIASAAAAAKSEDNAAASANAASNSAQSASASATSAAESVELTSGYKQEALTAKADAATSATNAKASENNAEASNEAAQSAARNANNFATSASSSASEAKSYRDAANNYAANAKNYSENVNVFLPNVSASGVLSWTNKAGLTNPASVNIKGAKGDTGAAASIKIGSVTTGAAGSNASVTNSGTASNVVLNFTLPRGNDGKDGKDGGITVDAELSDTSMNPVQNKVIKDELDRLLLQSGELSTPSSNSAYVCKLAADALSSINDITQTTIEQSADGETWETVFDSDIASADVKIAYLYGLQLPTSITIPSGYIARVTFATHTTTYFANISMFLVARSPSSDSLSYKCYTGSNTLASNARVQGTISTWGSWPSSAFTSIGYNIVQYVFNEDKKADSSLVFRGMQCKGTVSARNVLRFDQRKQITTTPFGIQAPTYNGYTIESSVPANAKFIDNETANTWTGQQTFNEVVLSKELYQTEYASTSGDTPTITPTITPTRSTMRFTMTKFSNGMSAVMYTLDMSTIVTNCLSNNNTSTVFTAYITCDDDTDHGLTITNAGTIKYIGSASDVAITSAGLLLNIMMLKDASGNLMSIVQASKLEGGA